MGIKDLSQFLKKLEPELFVQVPLSQFSGHTLAVDASIFLYKFMCITNQFSGNWIDMFIALVQWLRKWQINLIFVFDGKPPPEKSETQSQRKERKEQLKSKIERIEGVLNSVEEHPINETLPSNLQTQVEEILKVNVEEMPRKEMIFELNALYKKVSGQSVRISNEDTQKLWDTLQAMGLRCLKAVGEAEKNCAWLMRKGYVSGVITNDSDILVYGGTILIQDIKPNKDDCTVVRHKNILDAMDFTAEQFKDFCIMCGTDYNDRIYKVGPAKAFELLRQHHTIEKIGEFMDITPLLHERVRELLNVDDTIEFEGEFNPNPPIPNERELHLLLYKTNSRYKAENLIDYSARFQIN